MGSVFFVMALLAFFALPVIGYQYYLKSLRKQSDAIGMGKDKLENTIRNDLSRISQHMDPKTAGQAPSGAGGAAAKSKKLFEQMEKAQKSQLKKNPLLQK